MQVRGVAGEWNGGTGARAAGGIQRKRSTDRSVCATQRGWGRGDYDFADVYCVGELCSDARDEAGDGGCGPRVAKRDGGDDTSGADVAHKGDYRRASGRLALRYGSDPGTGARAWEIGRAHV